MLKQVTMKEYEEEIKEGIVLVDFFANWCGPCKMIAPILEELITKNKDIKILKVDVDKEQELSMKYGVMAIPTLLLYKDGEKVNERQGFATLDELEEMINEVR